MYGSSELNSRPPACFSSILSPYHYLRTSRLGANMLIIDYRGFGDSSGTPSETGLVTDAKAAFDWLISNGKKAEDILIMGHSLGTGVSGQLGAQFSKESIVCKGIVFLSVS